MAVAPTPGRGGRGLKPGRIKLALVPLQWSFLCVVEPSSRYYVGGDNLPIVLQERDPQFSCCEIRTS